MRVSAVWCVLLLAACDGPGSAVDGGSRGLLDAAALVDCRMAAGLSLGRCVDEAGAPCTGGEASRAAFFDALPDGEVLTPVVGPQGSAMFALAARTSGIEPGDPDSVFSSANPVLEIDLVDESGEVIATYRGRSGFRDSAEVDGAFENPQVFLIVDRSMSALRGLRLRADALLTDSTSERRCGSLSFSAGE